MTHGAYILARYSTDNQNADSIEVQVDKCRAYCELNKIPVLDVFPDYAVSGMKDERPQYKRMMEQLRAGGADTVVIFDQSRMFRKLTKWFEFREEIQALGVSVVSVTQPQIGGDLDDPGVFLSEGAMALMNQMWVLQTKQKVKAKMRYMAEQGLHTGGSAPLGYDVKDGRLVINEAEAETVRFIFREYASGKAYRAIIAELNKKGLRTKRGSQFGINSLHELLKNEKYVGVYTYGRSNARKNHNSHIDSPDMLRIPDACPVIIDRETFEKVRAKMEQNRRAQSGRPTSTRDYPLKGKVFCGECGAPLYICQSKRKEYLYTYYRCTVGKNKGTCDNPPISCDQLEKLVLDAVRGIIGDPVSRRELIEVVRSESSKTQAATVEEFSRLQKIYTSNAAQIENCTRAILDGLNSATISRKLEALEKEQADLDARMKQLHDTCSGASLPAEIMEETLDLILSDVASGGSSAAVLFSIVARVEVAKDSIRIWTIIDFDGDRRLKNADPAAVIKIDGCALRTQKTMFMSFHEKSVFSERAEIFKYLCHTAVVDDVLDLLTRAVKGNNKHARMAVEGLGENASARQTENRKLNAVCTLYRIFKGEICTIDRSCSVNQRLIGADTELDRAAGGGTVGCVERCNLCPNIFFRQIGAEISLHPDASLYGRADLLQIGEVCIKSRIIF